MAATIAVVPAIPDRGAFMEKVATRFRSLGRRIVQVVKKTGNWIVNLTPVRWAWNVAKSAASKVWGWVRPGVRYTHRYVLKPAAIGAGAMLGFVWGSKVLAVLTGLGVLGLIAVTVYVVRRRGKEKVVGIEIESTGAPQEPEEEKPKKTPRKRIAEAVDKVADALEESAKVIDTAAKEAAADTVASVKAKQAAAEAEKVKAAADLEAAKDAVAEANEAMVAKPNGAYKVRLPEGDLDPHETLEKRFHDLDLLLEAELAKPEKDAEFICELQGRQNLIHVRAAKHSQVKKDATVANIHNDFRDGLKDQWKKEHPGEDFDWRIAGIYRGALREGAAAENRRFNGVQRLKAEHDRIKGEAA